MAPHISADQRRQDLISAAFRVMADKGVAATSTRAICSEAGVPQSVFHYCFRSKEELLRELTKVVVSEMTSAASESTRASGSDLEDSLARAFDSLLHRAVEAPGHQLVLYELTTTVLRDPLLAELAAWQYEQYYSATTTFLEELAARTGVVWDIPMPVLSRLFITLIDGLILNWLADRNTVQAELVAAASARQIASLAKPTHDRGVDARTASTENGADVH